MKVSIHQCLVVGLAALAWSPQILRAGSDGSSTLSGEWGGLRRHWVEQGANFAAIYSADVVSNRRGGSQRGTKILDNIDLQLTLEGAKLFNAPGLTVLQYGLGNPGADPALDNALVIGAHIEISL